jgi:alkanesulfonate monooxygenase SsuD/methylene tetrahydromethanopterin reductase-like flavin-dependent oxidoreductase (luciferase family)
VAALDRFGVYVFPWGRRPPTVDELADLACHAEQLGFDSVHVPWHFTLPDTWIFPGFGNSFILDPLVVLPTVARRTSRIKIGFSSAILPTLHPYFWAQYVASLDVQTNGRVIAGAAVGWWPDDFTIGGSSLRERGKRMDEALEAVTRLWRGEPIESPGRFWDVRGLTLDPRPADMPPIWIGGGEKSIERTARWADTLMPLDMTPEQVRELRAKLDDAAARHDRDRLGLAMMNYLAISDELGWSERVGPSIAKCMAFDKEAGDPEESTFVGRPDRVAELAQQLFDAGMDYIVLDTQFHGLEDVEFAKEQMSRFAEQVAPLLD